LLLRIQDQKPNISFENMSGFLGSKRFEQTERGEVSSRNGKIEKSLFGRNQFVSKRVKELIVKQYKICGWLALRVCWRIKLFNNTDQVLVHYHHYASFIFNNYFNDKIFLGFSFSPNLNHHPFCINRSKPNTRLMPKLLSSNSVTTSFISTVPTVKCCPWKSELCLVVEEDVISITPVFHQDMNKILWKSSGKSSNFALWKSIARKNHTWYYPHHWRHHPHLHTLDDNCYHIYQWHQGKVCPLYHNSFKDTNWIAWRLWWLMGTIIWLKIPW